ncbi:hypothetical protein DEALK_08240 [Dehalogenimonas alkenigignens]|uniref:Uncharacterized protein n=1 Tax=Dehalogenimonas alkenigignens TaxID=1217799 RepID=A0A0W0GHF8_9CHLR|nr:hypothetical protein DEALK_08240 [Dehalogenimonas alkenigignens]
MSSDFCRFWRDFLRQLSAGSKQQAAGADIPIFIETWLNS